MNDNELVKLTEEEQQSIQAMRSFRRMVSLGAALFVLASAIALAIKHLH